MKNGAVSRSMSDTPCQNGEGGERTYVVRLALDSPCTPAGVERRENPATRSRVSKGQKE